jgi:hypothetical protein
MSAVGFEPTSANTVELESTPLDRSGTLTLYFHCFICDPIPKQGHFHFSIAQSKDSSGHGVVPYRTQPKLEID